MLVDRNRVTAVTSETYQALPYMFYYNQNLFKVSIAPHFSNMPLHFTIGLVQFQITGVSCPVSILSLPGTVILEHIAPLPQLYEHTRGKHRPASNQLVILHTLTQIRSFPLFNMAEITIKRSIFNYCSVVFSSAYRTDKKLHKRLKHLVLFGFFSNTYGRNLFGMVSAFLFNMLFLVCFFQVFTYYLA